MMKLMIQNLELNLFLNPRKLLSYQLYSQFSLQKKIKNQHAAI
jgi:hypothetical protein